MQDFLLPWSNIYFFLFRHRVAIVKTILKYILVYLSAQVKFPIYLLWLYQFVQRQDKTGESNRCQTLVMYPITEDCSSMMCICTGNYNGLQYRVYNTVMCSYMQCRVHVQCRHTWECNDIIQRVTLQPLYNEMVETSYIGEQEEDPPLQYGLRRIESRNQR